MLHLFICIFDFILCNDSAVIFSDCDAGEYGYNCKDQCSEHCQMSPCDRFNGVCPSGQCKAGYMGDKCDMRMYLFTFLFR